MKCSEALTGNEKPVAFSTFWRIWNQEYPFLKFRPTSSHAQCGTCMRHKMLIRGLTGHMKARQEQINQYISHLQSQYRDRICYWELRGKSRLKTNDILIILDGMDQQKFSYPRSPSFLSKELQGLNRPRAHISGVICHGRFVLFTVSPANVPKDANSCIETTAHCLQILSQETDLSKITLHVQSDNTSREVKNNHYLRWLGSLVTHRLSSNWHCFCFFLTGFPMMMLCGYVHVFSIECLNRFHFQPTHLRSCGCRSPPAFEERS